MKVSEVRIVPKDVHPWHGYVDALGHVFRPADPVVPLGDEIIGRRNTLRIPYDEKAFHSFDSILRLSGGSPFDALRRILSMPWAELEAEKLPLAGLARDCLERLDARSRNELVSELEETLSQFPDRYHAAHLLCASMSEDWLASIQKQELRLGLRLAQLSAFNHRGDTESEDNLNVIKDIKSLKNLVSGDDTQFRLPTVLADYYSNRLEYDTAEAVLRESLPEAEAQIDHNPKALHLVGQLAVVLATAGRTQDASPLLDICLERQSKPSDMERHFIYQAHLSVDKGEFAEAAQFLRDAVAKGHYGAGNLVEAAGKSQYLLHAALKLHALSPWLSDKELKPLMAIPPGMGHPWSNISYWRHACRPGSLEGSWVESLTSILELEEVQCPVLRLINACVTDQLRAVGVTLPPALEGASIRAAAAMSPAIRGWLDNHPPAPGAPHGHLAPLFFNFK